MLSFFLINNSLFSLNKSEAIVPLGYRFFKYIYIYMYFFILLFKTSKWYEIKLVAEYDAIYYLFTVGCST
jgi:hypothetical protein